MTDHANAPTMAELEAALPSVLAAPKNSATVEMLCLRPDFGERNFVEQIKVTRAGGIPGERWSRTPWLKLKNGEPDPRIQVCILGRRVLDLVWKDRENTPHPGDTFIADMDFSEENMPVGTLLQVGSAVLRVSDKFNDACVKWKARYGKDALDWVVKPENRKFRLRGVLCEVVTDGAISLNDTVKKL